MARRATVIKQERAKGPALLLDAGDSLTGDMDPAKKTRGATSVEAMNRLGYEAMTLGTGDLALGVEVLERRQGEANFPFLSANVWRSDTGQLLATPYITREVGGLRLAVIGVTDVTTRALPGLVVSDPVAAVADLVPRVKSESDFVIVLSHAGRAADRRMAAEVPLIDWIVAGGPDSPTLQPLVDEKTGVVIVQATTSSEGHAGLAIGLARLHFEGFRLVRQEWKSILLTDDIVSDPDMVKWVASKVW